MRNLIFTLSILFLAFSSTAQDFKEDFSYPAGNLLGNSNAGGTSWTENTSYPLSNSNPIQVVSPGLSFPSYSSTGNAIALKRYTVEGAGAQIAFKGGSPYIISSSATSGTIYVSFLISVKELMTSSVHFFYLGNNSPGRARIYMRKNPDQSNAFNFGVLNNSTGTTAWTPNTQIYSPDQTYMVVLKYVRVSTGNDQLSLFVFNSNDGASSAEPTPALTDATHNQKPDINGFGFRQGPRGAGESADLEIKIDGINISNTWTGAVVLPVKLKTFTSEKLNSGVKLSWVTVSETNNSHFDVLRADENLKFDRIGTIKGNGNSEQLNSYTFFDKNPLKGTNYYQLKQVDNDGKFELSSVVHESITLKENKLLVTLLPDNSIQLSFNSELSGPAQLSLHNIAGKILLNKSISVNKGQNSISLGTADIERGLIVVTVSTLSDNQHTKFIY